MNSHAQKRFSATQYALFNFFAVFFGKFIAGFSGNVQEAVGWVGFFIYAAAIAVFKKSDGESGAADTAFYEAKISHQDYYKANKAQPYCQMVIRPKLKKLGLEH